MVDALRNDCPEDVLALIPWYPDGPLSTAERGAVETHAAGCAPCREEIGALLGDFGAAPDVALPPADDVLARVFARVDRARPSRVREAATKPASRPHTAARRRAGGMRRLAFAASLAAAAGLGALVTWSVSGPAGGSVYYTAASASAQGNAGPLLEIIPRDEVSAAQLRTALRRIEGEIVAGPEGSLGRYRIRLPAGANAQAAAALLRSEGGIASYAEALHP